ncbi:transmembrane/coiled-coil protein (DUF726) [Citrus sinensis]|uniref:Transmembrane/coiled-coil protein (DUF726) n=1 Tax=Citrus sinensis TaxID=2711 RepID=A0ACB8KWY5_CITSI|nr:transmembrane/coiled-coil protein (DUF726) [Citrus sinensis]
METSTLTPRQKYAAAALFALALHQSQLDRTRHSYSLGKEQVEKEGEIINSESAWTMWKLGGIIGAASLTGVTVMAFTGGLGSLVPAIGASGFAAAASAMGSAAVSVAVAACFGASLTGSKMARRIRSIDEFEFKDIGQNHKQGHLAVGIMISGLVFEQEHFVQPWEGYEDYLERYALWWESDKLIALSTAIEDWLTSSTLMNLKLVKLISKGAMVTVLSTLVSAFALPATLVTASDLIDSKRAVAVVRSDKASELLAEVLTKGLQGNRPVTLVGFPLGAPVIFKCLKCLAETGDNAGFVEMVVLLEGPISIKDEKWEDARKMVAGRFVNAYSTNDWMLGVAFRASHSSYLWMTNEILEQLDLESYYPVFRTTRSKHL